MNSILETICHAKWEHIHAQKALHPLASLEEKLILQSPPRGFIQALRIKASSHRTALITEVKKASPSKGIIRQDFDPVLIATTYEQAHATCISVLTDRPYFQGEDRYLGLIRDHVQLPLLRKDFMLDPYQIVESRALGADCILLIMAALSDATAKELESTAISLNMDVLIEVHNHEELERALTHLSSPMIGINNRNLKTLDISLDVTASLVPSIPDNYLVVCESGIQTREHILTMQDHGIYCFLVGESLMKQPNIEAATLALLGNDDERKS